MKKLSVFPIAILFCLIMGGTAFGQTLYDSFSDGNFTANPVWGGTTSTWTVVANSDAAAGASGSNTVRLSVPAGAAGPQYLSSQIAAWGVSQEWGFWVGRRAQAFTASNQMYIWLYANEADLTSATVDGYRLAIGDDSGGDEIRLEYIVNGAVSATVITSSGALTNGLEDIGFLVRVIRDSSGAWQLFTSTLPTANGTGAIATDIPNSANTPVNQGTGTNNSLVPAANGYIGVAALHTTSAGARAAVEFDQVYFTATPLTAASATISGRATNPAGRGLSFVTVLLTGGSLTEPTYAMTNSSGYYNFADVPVGEGYVVSVKSKRYVFRQPSIFVGVNQNLTGVDFIGEPRQ